ncbi:MAG TPA: xanthine dehydrogenase accessory protein XdhC [Thermoanaerobaculia bacterium]|nr:xanthine dehydrogenase accessory protein XdhC [Thermoanaerobaculia bacterium]
MPTYLEALNELLAAGLPVVSVTIVDTSGSAPQDRGAKMIVAGDGLRYGTVGGGKVEAKAIGEAQRMLSGEIAEATQFVQWNLSKDVGMTCGGIVRLFFESYNTARWNVVVFGAGHVAQALVTLLSNLDCHVTCFDPREEWIRRLPSAPRVHAVVSEDMRSEVAGIPNDAFVVLMTMGHSTDLPILTEILRTRSFPYLGVIGSHSKAIVLRRDLAAAGLSEESQHAFHCPIGLDLGSNHPYEIAISIVGQMIQQRDELRRNGEGKLTQVEESRMKKEERRG